MHEFCEADAAAGITDPLADVRGAAFALRLADGIQVGQRKCVVVLHVVIDVFQNGLFIAQPAMLVEQEVETVIMSQNANLDGCVALVTGAARRVGAAVATKLHAHGADVAIHYRGSATEADSLVANLNELRAASAAAFQSNLLDIDCLPQLVADVRHWKGRLDILVNNASTFYPTPIGNITEQHWDDLLGSNLKAPLFLSQAAAPHLRDVGGVIVNIVDIHAQRPLRNHAVYGPAKAGLAMLTRALAKDLAPEVRVNGVSPGAILWPEDGMSEAAQQSILRQVPLERAGEPEDIANGIERLLGDPARPHAIAAGLANGGKKPFACGASCFLTGRALEQINKLDTIVFDKTGTLTEEQPHVAAVHTCGEIDEHRLLTFAAAADLAMDMELEA